MAHRRGFVLQPTYRIESGRPIVHVWGKLEDGQPFLIRDRRPVPHFYVEAEDADRAAQHGISSLVETDFVTMTGQPLTRIDVRTPPDTVPARDRLQGAGIAVYEADVRYGIRYLIDQGIRGSLAVGGESSVTPGGVRIFEDPEIEPSDWTPELSVLSLDIETDPKAQQILSVALHGCGAAEVLLLEPEGYTSPANAIAVSTEAILLKRLVHRIREIDPDVLTGWNVADFDFAVLLRRAEELGVRFEIGRGPGSVRILGARNPRQATQVVVPGRVVLDGLALVRGAFMRFESFSLDFVSQEVLGEGKLIHGGDRGEEIFRSFKEDRQRLVDYNLKDARLVSDILEKLDLVDLAVARSRLTGLPPDRVSASIAAFDFLYLSELGKRRIAAPSVQSLDQEGESTGGGHVLTPEPGLYENVLVLDFKSLYPSLIRTFQIDPLGYARAGESEDPIVAPNGASFRREPGILTGLLDELFPRREAAKKAGDKVASFAIKILMNSFFGVLGTSVCRFYSPPVANAITSFGRQLLLWSKERIESYGPRVLYGDTDSLFVESGVDGIDQARALGVEIVERLNHDLTEHIRETWKVESKLELEFEQLYLRLFLQPLRSAARGATKRYAGLVEEDGETKVVLTGLEAVRRDWTDLARGMQRELYERLFHDRPVEDYLSELVAELRDGRHDDALVYRKRLRKSPDEYTTTTPPHVAAARKMSGKPPRLIRYVITEAGPEPARETSSRLDYEHYVDKQIRPIAEPVLSLLGLEFKKVIGDETQMGLFD
jgi:DNA polymerase-2